MKTEKTSIIALVSDQQSLTEANFEHKKTKFLLLKILFICMGITCITSTYITIMIIVPLLLQFLQCYFLSVDFNCNDLILSTSGSVPCTAKICFEIFERYEFLQKQQKDCLLQFLFPSFLFICFNMNCKDKNENNVIFL